MNFQSPNLQDLEQLVTALLSEGKCACHIINPHKTRILMWKLVQDDHTTYHLRIGIQKFISQEQTDRNGETYWRYYSYEVKPEAVSQEKAPNNLTKFNRRQEKAQEYAKPNNFSELSVNEQPN